MNTGTEMVQSRHGLLTTVAFQRKGQPAHYALEGSVAITGALVQWLRDNLGLISKSSEIEPAGPLRLRIMAAFILCRRFPGCMHLTGNIMPAE